MDVTRSTFNGLLPQIIDSIDKATFLSIDCELSGLRTVNNINGFDSQKQYYEKVRRTCKEFLVIQFGICAFRYDEDANNFKQQAYNFYVFPKSVDKYLPDQSFLSQVSSIEFLISQGFDFNKLFKEGIPYLNSVKETKYREGLAEAHKIRASYINSPKNQPIPVPENDKPFMTDIINSLRKFIESNDSDDLTLPKCNSFLCKLICQTVRRDFENSIYLKTKTLENNDKVFVACKINGEESRKDQENKRILEEWNQLENTIGFSKVIKHIVQSNKLIVGHNMCLDLLHTIDKFLTPLPDDYYDFKDCAHCLFSKILDTKYMSSTEMFRKLIPSTVLKHLLNTVSQKPFTLIETQVEDNSSGYSLDDKKEHQAGYDAYITGECFISMWRYLGTQAKLSENETFRDFKLLKPFLNRVYLMRLHDSPYIQLGGLDPSPPRDHVFYMTFPKTWKNGDLVQLFSPFGNISISWIDDHSAYVGMGNRQQVAIALSTLSQSDTYKIMTYAQRQAVLDGLNTFVASPKPVSRKRLSDGHNKSNKSFKTTSFGEGSAPRRSIDAPVDSSEANCQKKKKTCKKIVPVRISKTGTTSKTFDEDDIWD